MQLGCHHNLRPKGCHRFAYQALVVATAVALGSIKKL